MNIQEIEDDLKSIEVAISMIKGLSFESIETLDGIGCLGLIKRDLIVKLYNAKQEAKHG